MRIEYKAQVDELNRFLSDLESELEKVEAPMKVVATLDVAAEEIFVNIAHYAYPGKEGMMWVDIDAKEGCCTIVFKDNGIEFNPLLREDPDITVPAEERQIGGLGIYMVKKTMDDVSYEFKDGSNIFSMTKRW